MSINALDEKTIKCLTTAQVITSVVTAVKELIENSIDAEASSVDVKLVDNGASLIEVSDNGTGIKESDIPFMALQSYTSKITDFCDLDSLVSYGFRGEALSSLCNVADVTVITKTRDDEAARSYNFNHQGSVESREICHHSVGTTVRVKSLFKDLPVRRQIMTNTKRSNDEVKVLFRSYGFCQPKIRFNLRINGANILTKPSTETPIETLSCLFGHKIIKQIEFVDKTIFALTIKLIIPRKDATEFNDICQIGQLLFANKRPIFYKEIEKIINKRMVEHFGDKIPSKKKLPFLLSLEVPSSELDVNLEPNKTSVLFTNEAKIIETLDRMLIQFYEIVERPSENMSTEKITVDIDESSEYHNLTSEEYHDRSIGDVAEEPLSKKRKITKSHIEDRISQLPIVDLGEDFNTQEIAKLPMVPLVPKITTEAWSKGQSSTNLRGGTDVQIYGNFTNDPIANQTTEPDSSSTGCKGFLKFSKEIRPQVIDANPGINFVDVAKSLTSRWKELSPEERGYYRDLALTDNSELKKNDTSIVSKKSVKQGKFVNNETSEKNKERLVKMLENMKNSKNHSKNDILSRRTSVPWTIDMDSVEKKFFVKPTRDKTKMKKNDILLGAINENLWLARTGFQIWALNVEQLFQGMSVEKTNFNEKTRDSIEELVDRWLREKDDMSLLHPVYEL